MRGELTADAFRDVLDAIDDGVVVLDAQRRIVAANAAFLRRTGVTAEELLGRTCDHATECMPCREGCPTRACLTHVQAHGQVFSRRLADGGTAWEEIRSSPVFDDQGNVERVIEVWRDISERRRTEARMAESHRLSSLGMLASGFSHELNTPLATLLACVEGIREAAQKRGAKDWSQVERYAEVAQAQLMRCRGTIQHFLRLARGKDAGAEILDLTETVAAVVRLSEPTAQVRDVRLRTVRLDEAVRVAGSSADLQHILVNLVLNAIEASPRGGEIRISVQAGNPACIRVSDDGCGIAQEDQDRIFEPFLSLRDNGIGLGLFLAQSFARRWGAEIRIRSDRGAGATFDLEWPALASSEASASGPATSVGT